MKKFIVFIIITAIILAVSSISAKAQYIYGRPTQTEQEVVQKGQRVVKMVNITETAEYQDAKRMRDKGLGEMFGGLIVESVGALALCVPTDDADGIVVRNALAGIGIGIGTLYVFSGGYKWIKGETRLRDLRLAYAMSGNGIVITF